METLAGGYYNRQNTSFIQHNIDNNTNKKYYIKQYIKDTIN